MEKTLSETRRFYHKLAEPGFMEFKTTINIIKDLRRLGIKDIKYGRKIHKKDFMFGKPSQVRLEGYGENLDLREDFDISEILEGFTGLIATIDTGNPGKNFAFRFDIDALPIKESRDKFHRAFREDFISENPNAMHACGHDGHLTIGIFLAEWLVKNKADLGGKYILIFQPAEEGLRGARSMASTDQIKDIDYFFSAHLGMGLPSGKVGLGTTGFLASTKLDAIFKGHSSHAGAAPEEGKNANLAAAAALLNLETLAQNSKGMARINVGVIRGGRVRNAIADKAVLELETRGASDEVNNFLVNRAIQIIKGSAISYDLDYEVKIAGSAPSIKKPAYGFYDEVGSILEKKGFDLVKNPDFKASEDVCYYINKVNAEGGSAIHFILGSDLEAGHHNKDFDFDEVSLKTGLSVYEECILALN
ncbi:amidohydrolase [uncultured Anaerococcus sp.]|uniref:amidohydrolase n=1 Tax=uncultured Anaerococcus sp. TaxID=293428 RepID=UPI0025D386E8|nr:amidohydrolase [uncultured Anaerococcus sp.]